MFIDILGYEGLYQINEFGEVMSLKRKDELNGRNRFIKEKLLKHNITKGYYHVSLSKAAKVKQYRIHQLVAQAFLNHNINGFETIINHIDKNKLNNHISNLEIKDVRYNVSYSIDKTKTSSKYIGVYWNKRDLIWMSYIKINGRLINLGSYTDEFLASIRYRLALTRHNLGLPIK